LINYLLSNIIEEKFYKKDYNEVTKLLLTKPINYEEIISVLNIIIDNKIFE